MNSSFGYRRALMLLLLLTVVAVGSLWLIPREPSKRGAVLPASVPVSADDPVRILDRFPVRESPLWPSLARGRWVLLLRNASCGHCGPMLEAYGELAVQWQALEKPWRVAVATVSEGASEFEPPQSALPPAVLTGTVPNPRSAFLVSPTLLLMVNGRAVKGWEGALDCQWDAAKETLLTKGL